MPIKSILIVDDSATDRQFLSELLAKNGFKVETAQNADEALTKDEATKQIPVIICTTKGQDTDKAWGMKQGARDYIVKPVKGPELLAKISALG